MTDDWVHPPGWDPESKAKADEERRKRTFLQKNRYCLIPTVLGVIVGLIAAFTKFLDYRGPLGATPAAAALEWIGIGLAFSFTMAIVIRILDGNSYAQSNAQNEKERKAAKRSRKLMWAFVPMILAILYFVLMILVTLITGDEIALASAASLLCVLAAPLSVWILVVLFVNGIFDAAEKRSNLPPTT